MAARRPCGGAAPRRRGGHGRRTRGGTTRLTLSRDPGPFLVVVLKGYPRLSETFVAHELAALERRGVRLLIAALRRPTDPFQHPVHAAIRAPVLYLPEYLREAPGRVAAAHLRSFRRAPRRYLSSLAAWVRDLRRDPTVNRVRRFGQAGVLAAELPAGVRHLHAHFLHTPASVARYAAVIRGVSYSLSGHAKDVWTTPTWDLRQKLQGARFTVTCTAQNQNYLAALAPAAAVVLIYHGLDRRVFAAPAAWGSMRTGTPDEPARLLTVARLQPKKGVDVLLQAIALLRRHVTLTVVGYGPLAAELRALADRLGLAKRIHWTGPQDQPAIRALYREHDLLVLAPRVAPDGDRDGLPNVLVEALSQGLPVVTTRVAAIPELVEDGVEGRLVPPDDPAALAAVLESLIQDPVARRRLGQEGIRRVAAGWDVETGAARLAALFEPAFGSTPSPCDPAPAVVATGRP